MTVTCRYYRPGKNRFSSCQVPADDAGQVTAHERVCTDSLLVTESASPAYSGLPFAFAQSRNVLLERSGAALTLHYVPPLATDVLLEVRRHVGEVFIGATR